MFSQKEQKAIKEKIELLRKVKNGKLTPKEATHIITQRRVKWLKENLTKLNNNYKNLDLLEKAYKIILLDHMKIKPKHLIIHRVSDKKLLIESRNFCPYLEACKKLSLDTKFVCKEIGEPSIQAMLKMIHPRLTFRRNYRKIRPNYYFCEEFIELR